MRNGGNYSEPQTVTTGGDPLTLGHQNAEDNKAQNMDKGYLKCRNTQSLHTVQ